MDLFSTATRWPAGVPAQRECERLACTPVLHFSSLRPIRFGRTLVWAAPPTRTSPQAPAARLTVCVHYKRRGAGGGRGGAMCVIPLCARRVRTALCGRTAVNPAPCHRSKHLRRLLFPNSRTSRPSRPRSACCSRRVESGSRTTRGGQRSWSFGVNPPPCRCHFSLVGVKFVFQAVWQYSSLLCFLF